MRLFWLCSVELPIISKSRGEAPGVFGGWLDQTSVFLAENNELTVCFLSGDELSGEFGNVRYYGCTDAKGKTVIDRVLNERNYDVYHIWGTEYELSNYCLRSLKSKGLLKRTVVSIQGLVSVLHRFYPGGISNEDLKRKMITGLFSFSSIQDDIDHFRDLARYEKDSLKIVKNVIGRTDWDKKCVSAANTQIQYYKCNENLRKCFYNGEWRIDSIERHTVFVSQCSYPVKGMHYIIKALSLVLKLYPDTKLICAGEDFIRVKKRHLYRLSPYARYLRRLVLNRNLQDHIEFRGILTADEMKEQYLRANVFVSASNIENSPNSVGEAMILGCPVVASYVGGVMDMIDHRKEGLLFQSGSIETLAGFIIDIFSDDNLAVTLSHNSRRRAYETHNIEKNNNDLMKIYGLLQE